MPEKQVQQVRRYVQGLHAKMAELNEGIARIAEDTARDIVQRITKGVPPPNSPQYAKWKKNNDKGRVPLICDGDYVDSIKATPISKSMWHVGPPLKGEHPSGISWAKLSNILEHGTRTIPARPHIEPARRRAEDRIKALMARLNRS
jgi:hypothetical protein